MKKHYNSGFSLLLILAIVLLMLNSHQLTAQTIPTKKNIPSIQKIDWREGANRKNATFAQVQAQFNKDWAGRKPKKGEGYKVFKRWENYMAPRVYPSGNMALPSSTYANYMAWQKTNASQQGRSRLAAPASTANFTELNPNAKASGYDSGVGRIDFVRFDPSNPNILYVCSPDGGLWKSINGGTTWTTNTDFLPIIGCSDLVIDPTNTQTMYLATGNRQDDRASIGILKSTNGGATWNTTALVFEAVENYRIRRLIMDPTNPQVMIAATDGGLYRTTDGWATLTKPLSIDFNLQDAEFKPGDPNTVYAVGTEFYKSTNKGVSWTKITSGLPAGDATSRALIAVTAANPAYVYALYGNTDGGYLGTFRSTDSGTSFTTRSSTATGTKNIINCDLATTSTSGQAGHNLAIVVSPTNAELVTIGGCNTWQSTNGGTSWTLSSYWLGNDVRYPEFERQPADYVHADIQSLDYLPGSNTTLFVTCDGGISKSTNNGGNWTDISHNLRVAQMTNVGQSSLTPYNMITGLQDIGTLKNSNGVWSVTNGGDGEDGFIDRTNDNNIITSNPNGAFALSKDGGVNRSDITGLPEGTEFFSPIHQDPVNAATVYAGGRARLYRSTSVLTNAGAAWTALGTPAGSGGIQRFEIAPSNNQVIYVLKGGNTISRSTNGGTSFANITGTLPVGDAQATNLCVSNTDANKVWVTFSGYNAAAKVYKSVNGGTTWTNISAGLPNIPMNTIVYLKNSASDAVYVGADIGVYYLDNTTPWTSFFTGLPNNHVNDLEIYYPTGKIRAATYGRGLWESNLFDRSVPVVSLTATDSVASEPPHVSSGGRLGAHSSATPARVVRRSANARTSADEPAVDHATFRFERDNADEKLPIEFEISGTAIHNVDHFFDDTTHFEVGEFAFDLLVFPGHDLHPEDHETLTLTLLDPDHYDVHHTDDAATITILDNDCPAPTLLTQSGQSYPGGQSAVTVSQNSGIVTLVVAGCSGTIKWSGPNSVTGTGTTIPVSTNQVGSLVYQATCQVGACIGTPASATVTVTPRLLVQHRDVDNYANNNTIRPLLQLQNQGTAPLPLAPLTLRYYLTLEDQPPRTSPRLTVSHAQLGAANISLRYVPLDQPRQGALGYIEYSFNAQAGSLAPGAGSGAIQSALEKTDFSPLNELNDYSYASVRDQLVTNPRITAYYNGVLVAGQEPPLVTPQRQLRALTESKNGPSATQIVTYLVVRNEGNLPVRYSELRVRYYLTVDGNQPLVFELDNAGQAGPVQAELVRINPPLANADTYVELRFNGGGDLSPLSSTGQIRYRIRKSNWSVFDQRNDYSYQEQPVALSANSRVVVFVGSDRVWGSEPGAGGGRLAAEGNEYDFGVTVLGNPVEGPDVAIEVRGAEGQSLRLELIDTQGKPVSKRVIERAGAIEHSTLSLGNQPASLLLLRVSTPTQSRTLKVLKAD